MVCLSTDSPFHPTNVPWAPQEGSQPVKRGAVFKYGDKCNGLKHARVRQAWGAEWHRHDTHRRHMETMLVAGKYWPWLVESYWADTVWGKVYCDLLRMISKNERTGLIVKASQRNTSLFHIGWKVILVLKLWMIVYFDCVEKTWINVINVLTVTYVHSPMIHQGKNITPPSIFNLKYIIFELLLINTF